MERLESVGTSIVVVALLSFIGVARAGSAATFEQWMHTEVQNFDSTMFPAGINDGSPANPDSYMMLNGQTIVSLVTSKANIVI
jgi:hypothetical protein